ncbi:MAG: hypothetical protein ACR2LN_04645 [Candidatus Levyibacteriota bacterium]
MTFTRGEKIYIFVTFLVGMSIFSLLILPSQNNKLHMKQTQWQIQSIDTMKYSRDMAKYNASNVKYTTEVKKQVADIANTGANYIAIDTPYDDEFLPVLNLWVYTAREHGLHIWFRGNWSGWEGWFGYNRIDEQTHLAKTKQFIKENKDLFQDGDIFSSCPECENGDAKLNLANQQSVAAYRQFLIEEYQATKDAFVDIHKNVASNYFSMNTDVAREIMDRETTIQLDGLVVIDHYVLTPEQLANDVSLIALQSGGNIMLGEMGAPIPSIHGAMTDEQQRQWLEQSLHELSQIGKLNGINYWVNKGGSTALWRPDGSPKPAVAVIKSYFTKNQ